MVIRVVSSPSASGIRNAASWIEDVAMMASRLIFLALPGVHAVRQTLVEMVCPYDGLYSTQPHALAHLVAYSGESKGESPDLQLLDETQQRITGGGVDQVHRLRIHQHMLHGRASGGQLALQRFARSSDAREKQVPAGP